ncbi:uncharacterized protein CDAR_307341 [Caerostris darwini]|uniref:MD-2-related lipid-recognition domain-containing protein n=1 Tax=Caerostris darwini TaxID=1538125 RepID=A0AAV4T4E9_9ARAC|nr:uncharacterized protein CDAR_307341 [Caerostris darwini]
MMKIVLLTLACIGLTHAVITFESCMKKNTEPIGIVRHFNVTPDPPSFSKNVTVNVDVELFKDIPDNALVKTNIYKVTGIFGIPIPAPCILGLGSCTVPYCKFLEQFKDQACPFFPSGTPCDCPIKANKFTGQDVTIVPPNLGALIKFIASGQFRIEFRLLEKETRKELMCYIFKGKALP